jgi:hypothetical protein
LVELEKRTGWRRLLRATLNDLLPPGLLPRRLNPEPTYADRVAPYFTGGTRLRIERAGRWLPPSRRWREAQVEPLLPPLAVGYENLEMEAASFGVDLRHPFTDRRLVDFMLTLPFEIKADAQRTKPILRDGLADVLPELVRRRAGKTYFNAVVDRRVDPGRCVDLIRSSGVRLPDVDYARFYKDVDRDPESVHRFLLVHLTRVHVFAAGGSF